MRLGNERGAILVASLLILALLSLLAAGAITTATVDTKVGGNLGKGLQAFYASEAGLEVGAGTLSSYFTQNLSPYQPTNTALTPSLANNHPFDGDNFNGYRVTYKISTPSTLGAPTSIPEPYPFNTSVGGQQLINFAYEYKIEATATALSGTGSETTTELIRVLETPLVQYYIFFNDDLTIHPGAPMTSWGRIHTNGHLGIANQATFTFNNYTGPNNYTPNTITVHGDLKYTSFLQQAGAVYPNSVWANRGTSPFNVRVRNPLNIPAAGGDYENVNSNIDSSNRGAQEARFTSGGVSHIKTGVDSVSTTNFLSTKRNGFGNGGFYERAALNPLRPGVNGMLIDINGNALRILLTPFGGATRDVTDLVRDYQVAAGVPVNINGWNAGARTTASGGTATTVGTGTPLTDMVTGSIVYSPESPVTSPLYLPAPRNVTHRFAAATPRGAAGAYNFNAATDTQFTVNPWYPCVLEVADHRENDRPVDFTVIDMQQLQRWYYDYLDYADDTTFNNSVIPADNNLLIYVTRTAPGTDAPVVGTGVGNVLQAIKLIGSEAGRTRGDGAAVAVRVGPDRNRQRFPTFLFNTNVVTPEPVYFEGDYNAPNAGAAIANYAPGSLGSAVVCDAVTILSNSWSFSAGTWDKSNGAFVLSPATHTTVNTAVFAGRYNFRDGGGGEEAGIHNFPRFLENWGGADASGADPVVGSNQPTITMLGCLINLWFSDRATSIHNPGGGYYVPPNRNLGWDSQFANSAYWPPYVPSSYSLERSVWQEK